MAPTKEFVMSYSIAAARAVLEESRRIHAEDARRRPDFRTARASASLPHLAVLTFADIILGQQEKNPELKLPEAVRLAAVENPELHKEWVERENTKMQNAEQTKKDTAARFRRRNR
jgi:hypothetical protein